MKNILFAALLFTAACTTKEPAPVSDSTTVTGGSAGTVITDSSKTETTSGKNFK